MRGDDFRVGYADHYALEKKVPQVGPRDSKAPGRRREETAIQGATGGTGFARLYVASETRLQWKVIGVSNSTASPASIAASSCASVVMCVFAACPLVNSTTKICQVTLKSLPPGPSMTWSWPQTPPPYTSGKV